MCFQIFALAGRHGEMLECNSDLLAHVCFLGWATTRAAVSSTRGYVRTPAPYLLPGLPNDEEGPLAVACIAPTCRNY